MIKNPDNHFILVLDNISMRFGGILALNKINLSITRNSITALIGPNGAGKTTLFNCITGFYKSSEGTILYYPNAGDAGINLHQPMLTSLRDSDGWHVHKWLRYCLYPIWGGSHVISRLGIVRTFQNTRLFQGLTVLENCLVAQHAHLARGLWSGLWNTAYFKQQQECCIETAYAWLDRFGLADRANTIAGALPYGLQRRLEIARALCMKPRILCLDEPAAGLNNHEKNELKTLLHDIRETECITIIIIEHDMSLIMQLSDEVIVFNYGEQIARGNPAAIQQNPAVIAAYLGDGA